MIVADVDKMINVFEKFGMLDNVDNNVRLYLLYMVIVRYYVMRIL